MAAAGDLHRVGGAAAARLRGALLRAGRLADRVGERLQVVTAGARRGGAVQQAYDFPAAGAVRRSECSAHRS